MKISKIYLTLMCLCLPAMMYAQIGLSSVSPVDIDLGVKVGANFAKLDGETWQTGYKAGFMGGIYGAVKVKKIGGQIEALLSQANYTTTSGKFYNVYGPLFKNAADSAKEGHINVTYLNVPVLFNYKLLGNAWIHLGPQFSTVLSVRDKDGILRDPESIFKNGAVSGVVGATLNLPLGLNVGVRYIFSFSDENNVNVPAADSWKNRTIQAHIGYNIF
jgi:hypothetical protein